MAITSRARKTTKAGTPSVSSNERPKWGILSSLMCASMGGCGMKVIYIFERKYAACRKSKTSI